MMQSVAALGTNYPPTVEELRDDLGYASKSTVHDTLTRLRDKGLVEWRNGSARTLRITSAGQALLAPKTVPAPRSAHHFARGG